MTTDIHTLAGAYVLDALSDIERAAFDRHLSACEACAAEVAELREAGARLADATWSVPPPRLRETVLAQVRQTRQLPPGRPERPSAAVAVSRWRRGTAAAVAAGILAAGAGAASYAVQEQRVREERATATAARAESARISAVLGAPDAQLRAGAPRTGGGRVTLVVSPSRDAAVALLTGLPDPGAGKAYQMWVIDGTEATSAGVLAAGETSARWLLAGVRGADAFGVTVEPAGGSGKPTLPVAVAVPL